jgi:hypothetical protein
MDRRILQRLSHAMSVATFVHRDQADKAGEPYLYHVLRVGMSLLPDIDAAVLGLLHDTIEDGNMDQREYVYAMLFDRPDLLEVLRVLSRPKEMEYQVYIERIAASGPLARKVKFADLDDNSNPERLARAQANGADVFALIERYSKASKILHDAEFCSSQPQPQEKA